MIWIEGQVRKLIMAIVVGDGGLGVTADGVQDGDVPRIVPALPADSAPKAAIPNEKKITNAATTTRLIDVLIHYPSEFIPLVLTWF
jgi:hypothetical protein